jgi:hypothetical protein
MIAQLLTLPLGRFLVSVSTAWAVGPVRVLAGLVAVPVMWVIVTAAALDARVPLKMHGAAP